MRKVVRRTTVSLAGVAVVLGIIVGMLPTRAVPVEYDVPPGVVDVNCGSAFSTTRWTNDEACDRQIVGRIIGMTLLWMLAVLLAVIALPLLILRWRIWLYGTST